MSAPTPVNFPSRGLKLAGLLFTPENSSSDRPTAAIVISHPGGGVKEQTPSVYARRLAAQGFVALVFDAAYQGESEGIPRGLDDPYQRSEDIKSAVSYLATRPDVVDGEKIGALGICASGGFVPFAAQTETRIKAVATVNAVDMGAMVRHGMDGKQTHEALMGLLAMAGSLRTAEANGAEPTYTHIVPPTPEEGGEAYDYYLTPRGQHPRSTNKGLVRNLEFAAQWEPFRQVEWISPRPLLMIAGKEAFSKHTSIGAIERASEPKELFWIEGATHMSLYDQDEHVTPAVKKLVEFFNAAFRG